MNVRELVNMLESDGWRLVMGRGGHRQFKHPKRSRRVTIVAKPSAELPAGTSKVILSQAGLRGGES
jgi:predicted RNA binding protein YcfA (HicA-like mRNA interferase family)